MAATNMPVKSLLNSCQKLLPDVKFVESGSFYWSPKIKTVYMNNQTMQDKKGQWALLHEVAHALLNHQNYHTDAGLLMLEVAAWQAALDLGRKLGVTVDEEHVQECLNTYRDWLYARSTCPTCALNSLQIDGTTYLCINCSCQWSVSSSRFCRPYRMKNKHKKTPPGVSQAVFV